jgi:hypothetical protein
MNPRFDVERIPMEVVVVIACVAGILAVVLVGILAHIV